MQRAQAFLALSQGRCLDDVAQMVGRTRRTVRRWQAGFAAEGALAVFEAPRSGRPPRLTTQDVMTICEVAVAEPPELGLPFQRWSLRHLADYLAREKNISVSRERLRQMLHAHNVRRQAQVSKQRSTDPDFAAKRDAVVNLYMHPPENSAVVCMDQLGPVSLRPTPGYAYAGPGQRPRHDAEYKRHGTIYALGALLPHSGTAFARAFTHYNSLTVIMFLGWLLPQLRTQLDQRVRTVYLILDNASAHTAKRVRTWLEQNWSSEQTDLDNGQRGLRVQLVFLPSKSAWLNLIEPFWAILKDELIRGSDFQGRVEFREALRPYLGFYNARCHPFVWGRQRKARVLLIRPLRRKLRGRAGARTMPPHLMRLIARAA